MTPSPERIEEIGRLLLRNAEVEQSKVLIFAEFDDGWMGGVIRYLPDGGRQLRSADFSQELTVALMNAWDEAVAELGDGAWRGMIYVLDHGRVNVRLLYADELGGMDDHWTNTDRAVGSVFSGLDTERSDGSPPEF